MRCRALPCSHCGSSKVQEQPKKTSLGSCTFRCAACTRRFNERSIPTNIVYLVVPWRLRYPPSLYLLAGMFLKRSVAFSHETVLALEALVAPLLTEQVRTWRKGKASPKWHADETYIEVHDVWCYLNRAIDVDGNLVGSMLSEHQDLDTARRFFARSLEMGGARPGAGDHRQARLLPHAHPGDRGEAGRAPLQPVPEQPAGAGSPGHQAALPFDAPVRQLPRGIPRLPCLRRAAQPNPVRRTMGQVNPLVEQRHRFVERLAELDTLLAAQASAPPAGAQANARRSYTLHGRVATPALKI